jgi:hypothetical protein
VESDRQLANSKNPSRPKKLPQKSSKQVFRKNYKKEEVLNKHDKNPQKLTKNLLKTLLAVISEPFNAFFVFSP